jgi:hypothetical protein
MSNIKIAVEPHRALAARNMLHVLKDDIDRDIARLEGAPFEARTVAVAIGNLAAQVDALANVLLWMLGDES